MKNLAAISRQVSPALLLDVSVGNCQTALVDKSGMITTQMGTHNRSGRSARVALWAHSVAVTVTSAIDMAPLHIIWFETHKSNTNTLNGTCWKPVSAGNPKEFYCGKRKQHLWPSVSDYWTRWMSSVTVDYTLVHDVMAINMATK
jgi:hypothetical protein